MPSRANPAVSANSAATAALRRAILSTLAPDGRLVLAVSGGRDSMALLDAVSRWRPRAVVAVATFDHGTGEAARDAVELVRRAAHLLAIPFVRGHGRSLAPTEAAWRAARWSFLRETARTLDARVATAHSRDDQVETIFIRALRGAGPRGLAGLYASSDIVRPFVDVPRDAIARYAAARGLPIADDPSNRSPRFLRNRVRLELLPALEAACPGFCDALLAIARRAAGWREEVECVIDRLDLRWQGQSLFVTNLSFGAYGEHGAALLWPALAARAGIVLDRRGTARLAAFSSGETRRGRLQLAGGNDVIRHARAFEIRRATPGSEAD